MTIRSLRLQALIAEHTPPVTVTALADALVASMPADVLQDAGRVTAWLAEHGVSTVRDDGVVGTRLREFGVTTARWARFLVVRRSGWFAEIGRQARNRATVDLIGPLAFNSYVDQQFERLLKAA